MMWDQIAGNWKELQGKVQEKWSNVTHDDLTVIAGKREQLVGLIQKRHGYEKAQADKEVDDFAHSCNACKS